MKSGGFIAVIVAICLAVVGFGWGALFETIEADETTVIQSAVRGDLTWWSQPGMVWQGWGTVTAYKKRSINRFEQAANCKIDFTKNESCGGIIVRFFDGGHAVIFGSVQYELPVGADKLTEIHTKYKGQKAIQSDLIQTVTNKSIYLVGQLMSSKESYAEKKNDLIYFVMDQMQKGVYKTRQVTEWVTDPMTKEQKQVTKAEIIIGKDGRPERQEESTLDRFGIVAHNFTITNMPYEDAVEKQITEQQKITMNMQTSAAEAKMAEQRAMTAEQQGKANATESKWKQETLKATAVTLAEQEKQVMVTNAERDKQVAETQGAQRLAVASLDKQAAEQYKQQQILIGQGDGERKKLVIQADGALEQKLATYERVMGNMFANLRGAQLVPTVVMGGSGGQQSSSANDFMQMLLVKAAKDIALDMSIPAGMLPGQPVPRKQAEVQ